MKAITLTSADVITDATVHAVVSTADVIVAAVIARVASSARAAAGTGRKKSKQTDVYAKIISSTSFDKRLDS